MLRSITFGRKLTINNSVIMKNINVSLFAILLCAFLRFLEQGDGNVFYYNEDHEEKISN
jgi:hypothetical protein